MPKTITDIIPPSRRRQMGEEGTITPTPGLSDMQHTPPPPRFERSENGKKFPYRMLGATVLVVIVAVALLFAFGGAKVEATPVAKVATVTATFTATPSAGDLPYQVITAETTAEKTVKAQGTETVDVPAQGTIVIYNAQGKTQELIKNTRFETPEGLIFRIRDSVQVPSGSAETPGELRATVYADEGGDRYNIGPSTFTLPGLKGGATYELVYAKSESGMTGGFSGTRPSVDQASRGTEYESMKAGIDADLAKLVLEKVPDGYVLLQGASFTDYEPQPDGQAASDSVALQERGVLTAYIFPKEAIARAIAFSTLGVYGGQPVTLYESDRLIFATEEGVRPTQGEPVTFNLSGETTIVWVIDPDELRGAIAGKSRDAARTILAGFSEIEEARLILKPFWEGSLPADPTEIEVVVTEPNLP